MSAQAPRRKQEGKGARLDCSRFFRSEADIPSGQRSLIQSSVCVWPASLSRRSRPLTPSQMTPAHAPAGQSSELAYLTSRG